MYVGILIDAGPIAAATAAAVVAGGTTPTGLVTSHSVGTATLGKLGHPCVPQENEIVARKNKIIYQIIGTYLSTSSSMKMTSFNTTIAHKAMDFWDLLPLLKL